MHSASPWASMAECLYSNPTRNPTTKPCSHENLGQRPRKRSLYDITGCWFVGNSRKNIYKKIPNTNFCTYQSHVMITYDSPTSHWVFRRRALSKFRNITLSDVLFPGNRGSPGFHRGNDSTTGVHGVVLVTSISGLLPESFASNHATLAHSLSTVSGFKILHDFASCSWGDI